MRGLGTIFAFIAGAAGGFALWLFSVPLTGRREPWDGEIAWYLIALFVIGFAVALIARGRMAAVYWGAFAGQVVFGLVPFVACFAFAARCSDQANLFPLGLVVLLVTTLPALVGALLGRQAAAMLRSKGNR